MYLAIRVPQVLVAVETGIAIISNSSDLIETTSKYQTRNSN